MHHVSCMSWHSVLWHGVVLEVDTVVSEAYSASIFKYTSYCVTSFNKLRRLPSLLRPQYITVLVVSETSGYMTKAGYEELRSSLQI
jgi:hypothetical protein